MQRHAIHRHAEQMPNAANETELELVIVYLVLMAIHMIRTVAVAENVNSTKIVMIDCHAFDTNALIHA